MMLLVGVFRSVNCLIQASEIEVDAFHLCLKQIDHDVRLMRVWQEKYATFESAMFFKKHDWLRLRNDELQTEAKKVLSSFVQIQVLESEIETMAMVTQFKREICNKNGCSLHGVVNLTYLNWCCPCCIQASHQNMHAKLLAWAMAENDSSCGIVMMPVFAHKKGQLWLQEKAALDLIHKGEVFADQIASVNFKNRVDARDDRPMGYPVRIVLPAIVDLKKSLWRGALRTK